MKGLTSEEYQFLLRVRRLDSGHVKTRQATPDEVAMMKALQERGVIAVIWTSPSSTAPTMTSTGKDACWAYEVLSKAVG